MAPIGEKLQQSDANVALNGDQDDDRNIWDSILNEVHASSSTALPSCKSLIVLGDNESGKTTLISRLQGVEDPRKGYGLEYHYINVKDDYRDDHTRLGVWILDGDQHHTGLLKYALNKDSFPHTLALLVVSMSHPWAVIENLKNWAEVLEQHIDRLKIPHDQMEEYRQSLVRHFQEYTEPVDGGGTAARRTHPNPLHPAASNTDEDKVLLPLGQTTLTNNLGIPLVVVVTKSDVISTFEKEHEYREEHFDFIQQHIRQFCLNYGAALFYTSVKEDKNCEMLLKYLTHRIYGFPFIHHAYVVERDSVFVPCGWDNEKKISILHENMTSMKPDDVYEDVIVKPIIRKPIQRDSEIAAEDEQVFLLKLQTQLSKQPVSSAQQVGSSMRSPSQKATSSPRPTNSPSSIGSTPKKPSLDGKQPGTSEGVLANFFNSLLTKKSGAPGGTVTAGTPSPNANRPERAAVSRDAAAELHRMTRDKKPVVTSNSTNAAS